MSKNTWEKTIMKQRHAYELLQRVFPVNYGLKYAFIKLFARKFLFDAIKEKKFNFVDKRLMSGQWQHEPNP